MLLRNADKKDTKPTTSINNNFLLNQSKNRIFIKAPLINKTQHLKNHEHKENKVEESEDHGQIYQSELAEYHPYNSSPNQGVESSLITLIPHQFQFEKNSPFIMDQNIPSDIPCFSYQQYQQFTSSSYLNEGITIQQNLLSTTTVTLSPNNTPQEMLQLTDSTPQTFLTANTYTNHLPINQIENSTSSQLFRSHSHTLTMSSLASSEHSSVYQLSNSFKNLTHSSSNMSSKDEIHNLSDRSSNNSCNFPINGKNGNNLSRFNPSITSPVVGNNLPEENIIPAIPFKNNSFSQNILHPQSSLNSFHPHKSQIPNQLSSTIFPHELKEKIPTFKTENLTPSRRMINIMEERVLIPPTGISSPVPNIIHITKKINCNPNVMRCTLNTMPYTEELLTKTRLPLAILLHPFRDLPSLQVIRSKKIIRCRTLTCRAYINPFVSFIDQKRWKCNMCLRINELSDDTFYNSTTDEYFDIPKKFELRLPTVEYIAPKEYSLKNSQAPLYVFMIDVSCNATHLLYHNTIGKILNTLEQMLDRFPGYQQVNISIIAYDSCLHFYSISERGFQEIVVSDITSPVEIPEVCNLVIDLHLHHDHVQHLLSSLLDNVDNYPHHEESYSSCLGTALVVAKQLFITGGGRITIFNASCPSIGDGVLTPRQVEKSATVLPLNPVKDFYKTLSLEFAQAQIAVDLFQLGSISCDLPSLSIITRYCAGSLFYYPDLSFSIISNKNPAPDTVEIALNETQRLLTDLHRYLTRKIGFEAVLRIRFSGGFNILSSHGNFFARASDLFSMANVNPDSGVAIRLGIEDSFIDTNAVFFQAALLYTSSVGERRIRVHTLCLPVSLQIEDVFRMADHQAVAALLAKSVADRLQIAGNVAEAREALINAVIDPSMAFGKFCLSSSQRLTSLPFPYNLRMLPLFVWGILQSKCLRVRKNDIDLSVSILDSWRNMPLTYLLIDIYPGLYNLISVIDLTIRQTEVLQGSVEHDIDTTNEFENGGEERAYSSETEEDEGSSWESDEVGSDISCYNAKVLQSTIHTGPEVVSDVEDDFWYPEQLHLSSESLSRSGVYLLDTIKGIFLFLGVDTPRTFLKMIFGVESRSEIRSDGGFFQLPDYNNACSAHLRIFLREIQVERPLGSSLYIVNNDKSIMNAMFLSKLLEDDNLDSSYHRFLQHVQKKVNDSNI